MGLSALVRHGPSTRATRLFSKLLRLAFRADEYYWRDLGRPAHLAQASLDLIKKVLW